MTATRQVHNLILLDESGSMQSISNAIIQGFNEVVQTIKGVAEKYPEQEHRVSFISFNGLGQTVHHFLEPIEKLEEINAENYNPNSMTPLYDAIGFSVEKIRQALQSEKEYNVLVTIMTDGAENASKEYTSTTIKQLVEELEQVGWTFTYIGTDHDVVYSAEKISIRNTMSFVRNKEGIKDMFSKERDARERYSDSLRMGMKMASFYEEQRDEIENDQGNNKPIVQNLTYDSSLEEVEASLKGTIKQMELNGETQELKFEKLLKEGRVKLLKGEVKQAYRIFHQCMLDPTSTNSLDIGELYFWSTRCQEELGNKNKALRDYLLLLEKEQATRNNQDLINAILDRLIEYGDISKLVEDFKKRNRR